jgi:hypothetical protein
MVVLLCRLEAFSVSKVPLSYRRLRYAGPKALEYLLTAVTGVKFKDPTIIDYEAYSLNKVYK